MKTRIFTMLAMVVMCILPCMVHAATDPYQATSTDTVKMVCIAAEAHVVGIDDGNAPVSASGLPLCERLAKQHPREVAICDLDQSTFADCLSNNAANLVKRTEPAAWYTSHVTVINELNHTSKSTILLLPRHGTLNIQFAGASFKVSVDAIGKITLNVVDSGPNQTVFINS